MAISWQNQHSHSILTKTKNCWSTKFSTLQIKPYTKTRASSSQSKACRKFHPTHIQQERYLSKASLWEMLEQEKLQLPKEIKSINVIMQCNATPPKCINSQHGLLSLSTPPKCNAKLKYLPQPYSPFLSWDRQKESTIIGKH